jgi:23S rRNA pseudouridine2605 synthase
MSIEEIGAAHREGHIQVQTHDGDPFVPAEEDLVFPEDRVLLNGTLLPTESKQLGAYVLFKPKNVTVTTHDPKNKRDLRPWLAQMPPGYFPVGRLDRETTGALLFCNDGDLATAVLRPDHHLEKLYWLWLREAIAPNDPRLETWTRGIPLMGTVLRAEDVHILSSNFDSTELLVTLKEGKNRQLRRMCRFSDFRLLHLHRKSIGPIDLCGTALGEIRRLSEAELSALWLAVGGREQVRSAQIAALKRRAAAQPSESPENRRLQNWLIRHAP